MAKWRIIDGLNRFDGIIIIIIMLWKQNVMPSICLYLYIHKIKWQKCVFEGEKVGGDHPSPSSN